MNWTEIDERDLYWAAGLLDGEGCFSLRWLVDARYKHKYPAFTIQCNMTDKEPVEQLHRLFGGNIRGPIQKQELRKDGQLVKPHWRWNLSRTQGCIELCKLLQPLLCPRRQAKIAELLQADTEFPQRPGWRHGTVNGYEAHGCRCDPCKAALAKRLRTWRAAHKEEYSQYRLDWKSRNKDTLREQQSAYYARHAATINERRRAKRKSDVAGYARAAEKLSE